MKKSILTMVVSLALVGAVGVGSTLAYLSSTPESKVNTFTVGKVGITLDEATAQDVEASDAAYPVLWNDAKDESEHLLNPAVFVPGTTYIKKPTVTVTEGSEDSYVFMKVEMPVALATLAFNGTITSDQPNGFYYGSSAVWQLLGQHTTSGIVTAVFQYVGAHSANGIVPKDQAATGLEPLFTGLTLSKNATKETLDTLAALNSSNPALTVSSFAIQANSITAADFNTAVNGFAGFTATPVQHP